MDLTKLLTAYDKEGDGHYIESYLSVVEKKWKIEHSTAVVFSFLCS